MTLEILMNERKNLVRELKANDELQLGLEKIKRYNFETNDELKVYNTINYPDLEEITESLVAERIAQLTDDLLKLSEQINKIKLEAANEISA
ncbi:MAG: hypothetical protein ACLPWD_09445 [Methanobacterium sp.]